MALTAGILEGNRAKSEFSEIFSLSGGLEPFSGAETAMSQRSKVIWDRLGWFLTGFTPSTAVLGTFLGSQSLVTAGLLEATGG